MGTTVCVVRGNMANDNDAADSAFGTLWEKAKQDLKHRMVPANEIIQMVVEFYGRPPPVFDIVFTGANAVPVQDYLNHVLGRHTLMGCKLLFPPMPPSMRLQHARDAAKALEAETKAAKDKAAKRAAKKAAKKKK